MSLVQLNHVQSEDPLSYNTASITLKSSTNTHIDHDLHSDLT